jgi:DNA-binding beta-propeller fold protein YncE
MKNLFYRFVVLFAVLVSLTACEAESNKTPSAKLASAPDKSESSNTNKTKSVDNQKRVEEKAAEYDELDGDNFDLNKLLARGKDLYERPASCSTCHGEEAKGLIGPSLHFGPDPANIFDQMQNNPQMAGIAITLKPTDNDLVAISFYIRQLANLPSDPSLVQSYRKTLAMVKAQSEQVMNLEFPKTERDKIMEQIQSFDSVLADWTLKSTKGPIGGHYESRVVATFDPGEPKFVPEKGGVYFYENLGNSANLAVLDGLSENAKSSQVVVGDAKTKQIIASYEIPVELRAAVHTTVLSPDGKFVYIVGSKVAGKENEGDKGALDAPATLLKVDALTLQPIKQITIGGRLHHGQVFQDKYLLLDTFSRETKGLDIFLYDPETDKVIGGVRDEDLGGSSYTAWADNQYIYVLMEPTGYASHRATGMAGVKQLYSGKIVAMKPFWVVKIDPSTWEVVKEYPFPGYRGDWVVIDSRKEYMYVTAGGSSNVSKINLVSGAIEWTSGSGIGPYGATLNADETELWIADKGEGAGHFGRTLTVLDAKTGNHLDTVFSGYEVDHVLLAPNGKEIWATSNGEGRIYVFDAVSRKQTHKIDMPQFGDPHGLVWTYYDESLKSRVIRDQGGFHGGVNPALDKPIDY